MSIPRRRQVHRTLTHREVPFTDHANRPACSLWSATEDDDTAPPTFSFQVYTTSGTELKARFPIELFSDDVGAWRIDVYEQLPDVWACIEHQRLERMWRKERADGPGKIVGRYGEEAAMGGFIIVIDRPEWYWQNTGDDGRKGGPLGVWFDPREQQERRIVSGGTDIDGMVFEQLEIQVGRMATPSHPNYELYRVWGRAGMWDWEEYEAGRDALAQVEAEAEAEAEAETQPETQPPLTRLAQLASARITVSDRSIVLQTDNDPELVYTVYPIFATTTPADLISIARQFAAHLTSRSVRLEVVLQLPGIGECIAYAATADTYVGYRTTSGRRFPEYGAALGTMQMQQGQSQYKRFLVVLDSAEWEREDGVCFVWVRENQGILVGRVGGGMVGVAERLGGVR